MTHETAQSLCSNMGKPSAANARTLSSLFLSSQPVKRMSSDPLADCVASAAKQKKKAVRIKPRKVTVVWVDDTNSVPRYGKRKALKNQGKTSISSQHVSRGSSEEYLPWLF